MSKLKILLLTDVHNYANDQIKEKGEARGHRVDYVSPNDFLISFGEKGKIEILCKDKKILNKYDAVIPRLGRNRNYGTFILKCLIEQGNLFSTATPEGLNIASDKLSTALAFASVGLPIPKTITVKDVDKFDFIIKKIGGLPCILKTTHGSQGNGIYLFRDALQSSITLKNFRHQNMEFILQQFIETAQDDEKKNDMRCWVVGDEVVAAFRRFSTDKDVRSNYSISRDGETVELTKLEKSLAIKAAKSIGLGICGVDIARDINRNDAPIIYEINGCADLKGIETVTKISIATEIIKYVEKNVGVILPSQDVTKQGLLYADEEVRQKMIDELMKL